MQITINPKYQHDADLRALLHRLPEAFAAGEGELIYDKRNKLRRFSLPSGRVIVVKAYHHPNLFQRLCYSTFWSNKAIKSYDYGMRLLRMGIDTPEPIACITYHKLGCLVRSYYFVSTEDTRPDCKVLTQRNTAEAQPLIEALATFLAAMHRQGFLHGDANLSNFLYSQDPTDHAYHFAVIDTNRSRFLSRPATQDEVLHNLMRLTHIRPVLGQLVRTYARQQGWDETKAEQTVLDLIKRRERRKAFWHRFKK